MAGPGRIAGVVSFFIEGVPVTTKGSMEYKVSGSKREPIMGGDLSFAGYSETGDAPYMSITLLDDGTVDVASLFDRTNVQLIANLANGGVVTGHSMTMMEAPAPKNDSAEMECKWIGVSVVVG